MTLRALGDPQKLEMGDKGWGRGGQRTVIAQVETQGQGFTPTDEDKYIMCLGRQALLSSDRLVSFADSLSTCGRLFDLCSSRICSIFKKIIFDQNYIVSLFTVIISILTEVGT